MIRMNVTLGKKVVLMLIVTLVSFCKTEAKDVVLKSGTQVPLELQGTVTSKNVSNGSIINFIVKSN